MLFFISYLYSQGNKLKSVDNEIPKTYGGNINLIPASLDVLCWIITWLHPTMLLCRREVPVCLVCHAIWFLILQMKRRALQQNLHRDRTLLPSQEESFYIKVTIKGANPVEGSGNWKQCIKLKSYLEALSTNQPAKANP